MSIYTLDCTQIVHTSLEHAWDFFSSPRNLQKLTPEHLGFQITSELPEKMYPGMVIEYRVRPLLGIPITWLTEISHVEHHQYFVDEQRHGPYRIWHHEHFFRKVGPNQVEMRDKVTYQPPFGILGDLVHPVIIRPQLDNIFRYRREAVDRLFPSG